jgi:hypothetical protein
MRAFAHERARAEVHDRPNRGLFYPPRSPSRLKGASSQSYVDDRGAAAPSLIDGGFDRCIQAPSVGAWLEMGAWPVPVVVSGSPHTYARIAIDPNDEALASAGRARIDRSDHRGLPPGVAFCREGAGIQGECRRFGPRNGNSALLTAATVISPATGAPGILLRLNCRKCLGFTCEQSRISFPAAGRY